MMRTPSSLRFGPLLALAALGVVVSGCGEAPVADAFPSPQGQQAAPPVAGLPDTIQLNFEREVFSYPSFQRRNPFAPVTAETSGPRFEDLELQMVIVFQDGQGSIATLAPRGSGGRTGAAATSYRVREGDVIGNMRIVAIRLREIVVDVEEFSGTERRVMELRRAAPEATTSGDEPPAGDTVPPAQPDTIPPDTTGAGNAPPPPDTTASTPGNRNGGSA